MDTTILDPHRRTTLTSSFKSTRTKAKWCTLFLVLHGIIVVVSIISTMSEISLLQRIEGGEFVSATDALSNDDRQAFIGLLYILSFVAAVITFLVWIYGTSKNLRSLGWEQQRFSPGWAVSWWFVPIFWLFRPYQVMKEIWKASLPASFLQASSCQAGMPTTLLLGPWWATWLISGWIGSISLRIYFSDDSSVSGLITADIAAVVSDVISLVALVLVLILIWQIASNQEKRRQTQTQGEEAVHWSEI